MNLSLKQGAYMIVHTTDPNKPEDGNMFMEIQKQQRPSLSHVHELLGKYCFVQTFL